MTIGAEEAEAVQIGWQDAALVRMFGLTGAAVRRRWSAPADSRRSPGYLP